MANNITFTLDSKKDKELFNKTAELIARGFVEKKDRNPNGVSRHQIRKMYENIRSIERSNEDWDVKLPKVKMIRSQTAYAIARAIQNDKWSRDYYYNLKSFIDQAINQINDEKEFITFCSLFEAVYGFYYAMGGSNTK